MKEPTVHILATVRNPRLLPGTTLVFKSLRVGFPKAPVMVWGNALEPALESEIVRCAQSVGGQYTPLPTTSHDEWIENLVQRSQAPLWICDTDVVFQGKMQNYGPEHLFAGRFEQEFDEEWTGTRHMARLHTAVMWLNPVAVRNAMRSFMCQFPAPWRDTAEFPFIRQHFVPLLRGLSTEGERGRVLTMFYDTCAGLFHACGGTIFNLTQDRAFEHLHCATYSDLVGKSLSCGSLEAAHRIIFENPSLARGMKAQQDAYYESRRPKEPLCPTIRE